MLLSQPPLRLCSQCRTRFIKLRWSSPSRLHTSTKAASAGPSARRAYFSANGVIDSAGANVYAPTWSFFFTSAAARKSTTKASVAASAISPSGPWTAGGVAEDPSPTALALDRRKGASKAPAELSLPPDAPSRLTELSSSLPQHSLRRTLTAYLALSKPRLSVLIVLTTATAYSLYPTPALLLDAVPAAASTAALSAQTLAWLTTGTFLCSASANALNMRAEPDSDARMSRTRARPIVRGLISRQSALGFAAAMGSAGVALLSAGANPIVAALGALNILLYAGVYTPLKRVSAANTWAGAVVGAIPPLMGWAAAAGEALPAVPVAADGGAQGVAARLSPGIGAALDGLGAANFLDAGLALLCQGPGALGGWLLAGLLFAWQFPHFCALSHPIRHEYRAAGLRMLAWTDPARNARVALRYALALPPLCVALYAPAGVVSGWFVLASAPLNAWIVREGWRFWRGRGPGGGARGLFWASVWYLPGILCLAMACKKGLWERVWQGVHGAPGDDGDEEWDEVDATLARSG